jgi:transposase
VEGEALRRVLKELTESGVLKERLCINFCMKQWLAQLADSGLQRRAQRLYQKLDVLQQLRREARQDLIVECRKHREAKLLRTVPWLGPIRVGLLLGRVQTPHRFRTKRQFWAYCGLALETRDSGE